MAERKPALIVGGIVAAVAAAMLLALLVLWLFQRGEILPNTMVAGVEIGGLTPDEAAEVLQPVADARHADTVTFTFEEREFVIAPEDVSFEVAVDESVQTAARRGRAGLPGDLLERVRALWTEREYPLQEQFDAAAVESRIADIVTEVDREEFDGAVTVDVDDLDVSSEYAVGRAEVRVDELTATLTDALGTPGTAELPLPVDTTPQPVSDADVDRVAEQVRAAVAGPLVLNGAGETLTLEPATIARLLSVEARPLPDGDAPRTLAITVTPDAIDEVLGDTVRRFDRDPVEPTFVVPRTPPSRFDDQGTTSFAPVEVATSVEGGTAGSRFEADRAAEQLAQLFTDNVREAELELAVVEPELPRERAEALRPTHVIGTFTTYYTGGDRVQNIQRLADVVDGDVVLPGEQFSINELSGERRCEKGYVEAGTIVQGELVDTCGGGVSQFGTTTFNAAFFAGVRLDQWKAHSWYISRYPMGREATLSYPVLDVRFTNDTPGAIVVRTSYTNSSITVTLFGQPRATVVRAQHGSPTNYRDPDTIRRVDDDGEVPCGEEVEVQGAAQGFTVEVVRTVELLEGGSEQRTIRTVYDPVTRILERGPPCPPDEE
ncbi:MAG TPA: VanW family protein [Egicoccus sp.]|nr:VanW family protein [Egicoccus sp.]HSK22772.1 VanW family protein [Egicoccus sp.]